MHISRASASAAAAPVVFFGMGGGFSAVALASLLEGGARVLAVITPDERPNRDQRDSAWRRLVPAAAARSTLPVLAPALEPNIVSLAWERGIETFATARRDEPATTSLLADLGAMAGCVACWPWIVPASVLSVFPAGMLNIHPALLPAHRGPAPLFWTLRRGDAQAGVTVHVMEQTLDSGPIVAQEALALVEGESGEALEGRCAALGGRLVAQSLTGLATGLLQPRPQPPGGSYESWPEAADFVVTPDRSARWAFNFARGATYWGGPIVVAVGGERFTLREALGYAAGETLGEPFALSGERLALRCDEGIFYARVERL